MSGVPARLPEGSASAPAAPAAAAAAAVADPRRRFLDRLGQVLADRTLAQLTLARPTSAAEPALERLIARPVVLKDGPRFALTRRYRTRDTASNLTGDALLALVDAQLGVAFAAARFETDTHEGEFSLSKRHRPLVRFARRRDRPAQASPSDDATADTADTVDTVDTGAVAPHNREKPRRVPLDRPFLAALGVTDAAGRLVPSMARKWRQIDKFIDVFDGAWRAARIDGVGPGIGARAADSPTTASPTIGAPERPLAVVDYGAGKGYLTFALYDHLTRDLGLAVRMTGVERRADLVDFCNRAAAELGFAPAVSEGQTAAGSADAGSLPGLVFRQGEIDADDAADGGAPVDVVIALHACDTATDDALAQGVRAGAAILVASPCCHRELRPQLLAPGPLAPVLRHGVHRGEAAEMLTDSLRALALEARGFDAQVFEFVSLEHTPKNKMILATRRRVDDAAGRRRALDEIVALKAFYGITTQRLDHLLQAPGAA